MRFRAGSDGGFCFQEMGGRAAKRFHARFVEYVRIMGRRGLLLSFLLCFFFAMLPVSLVVAEEYAMHGTASWYGTSAHGKQTASGERFDRYSLTAAHKTLPFGTVLRVYNLKNRSHTLVRVADRGPFVKGRIVDVSRRAAEQLKMTRAGVATVAIEAISNAGGEPLDRDNSFYLHVADETTQGRANAFSSQLRQRLNQPVQTLFSLQETHPAYAVCLGPYKTFEQAELIFTEVEKKSLTTRGIIEAPTKGGDVPRHVPPSAQPKKIRLSKRNTRFQVQSATPSPWVLASSKKTS